MRDDDATTPRSTAPRALLALALTFAACGPATPSPAGEAAEPTTGNEPDTSGPDTAAPEDPARERACRTDDDCSVVRRPCTWEPVDVEHRAAVQQRIDDLDVSVSCDSTGGPVVATSAGCADGQCEIRSLEQIEWRDCAADADCVAVSGVCGGWDAASRTHVASMRAHYEDLAARVRCASREPVPTPTPVCRVGLCVPR